MPRSLAFAVSVGLLLALTACIVEQPSLPIRTVTVIPKWRLLPPDYTPSTVAVTAGVTSATVTPPSATTATAPSAATTLGAIDAGPEPGRGVQLGIRSPSPVSTPVPPMPSPTATPTKPVSFPAPSPLPALLRQPDAVGGRPDILEVAPREPSDVVRYLVGRLDGYPGTSLAELVDFSASNIIETMDTLVLDQVRRDRGEAALRQVYDVIARAVLATLREQYGDRWVLVPIDAGHGGKKGVDWDGGAGGTEADHNRAVVASVLRFSQAPEYARLIPRLIYNDDLADSLAMPRALDKVLVNRMLVRQGRASMLAYQAAAWSAAHSDAPLPVHEVSVHFNAGAQSALVLHQGETVRPEFRARSVDFARRYLALVTAGLNDSGLLPSRLRLWNGNGLHDDVMMYRPDYLSDADIAGLTLRYAALQGRGYLSRYAELVVASSQLR